MKIKILLSVVPLLFFASPSFSQSKKESAVTARVEALKKAMADADAAMLDKITLAQLSYGHSSGAVETKNEFIENIRSGKSDFVSISLSHQTISVSGNTALVRHKLDAVTNNEGKPGEVHLLILLVWQKHGGSWKLLARQAVKQP
jgi:ketosteroid isomerase-like protein